ncbi:proline dehydrogenase family protein [Paenibacillus sp. L3-i20]|uniref:proline dehydrogenase family protein n=1 Tax=Paenibacillus sp. L3-i20 TaxID=2905833 RepID=UPI001EE07E0A|nr:proline dehydrogenase family protein [Paenibacillus sp. L3-i20]GKU76469.1 proline dehydrogenase [Paenibacillus sp. L3-i20]
MPSLEEQVTDALKSISRNEDIKSYVQESVELYPLLWKAARRFVTGESKQEAIHIAQQLKTKGYAISLEYIGENTTSIEECERVKNEFLALIDGSGEVSCTPNDSISLDLSHIGLSLDENFAYTNLLELAAKAEQRGISIMIGMEESSKTDAIILLYKRACEKFTNVGITIQAQLHRSEQDLQKLLHYPGRIRLVKGAYQEHSDYALPRSIELNNRYLEMAAQILNAKHPVTIATHDENLLQELELRYDLIGPHAQYEMLYGIRPDRLSALRHGGNSCKVYLPYGKEWYLYVCHRIAENPENVYRALTDIIRPYDGGRSMDYE